MPETKTDLPQDTVLDRDPRLTQGARDTMKAIYLLSPIVQKMMPILGLTPTAAVDALEELRRAGAIRVVTDHDRETFRVEMVDQHPLVEALKSMT